jgi:hypothetical protein
LANEPKKVTTREGKLGFTLTQKQRNVEAERKAARQWLRSGSGLSKSETKAAVKAWIAEHVTTPEGQAKKLREFEEAVGW